MKMGTRSLAETEARRGSALVRSRLKEDGQD